MRNPPALPRAALLGAGVLLGGLLAGSPALAQDDLRKDVEELKKGQEQILKQLQELKQMLQAQAQQPRPAPAAPAVKDVVFNLGANAVQGNERAKLTLVEFTDYQWPFCSRYVRETYAQIKKDFIDTGKIRYATLDMPLESIHKLAFKAAEATHCAEDQGKFWEMSHRLMEQQKALEPWKAHAEALGLDAAKFEECMTSGRHAPAVRKDMVEAQKAGVTGTPGFLIALTDPADKTKVKGLTTLRGAQPYDRFKTELDQALAGPAK